MAIFFGLIKSLFQRKLSLQKAKIKILVLFFFGVNLLLAEEDFYDPGSMPAYKCGLCHYEAFDAWQKGAHFKIPQTRCQGCHQEFHSYFHLDCSVCYQCHSDMHADFFKLWGEYAHLPPEKKCRGCHNSHSLEIKYPSTICRFCHRNKLILKGYFYDLTKHTHNFIVDNFSALEGENSKTKEFYLTLIAACVLVVFMMLLIIQFLVKIGRWRTKRD